MGYTLEINKRKRLVITRLEGDLFHEEMGKIGIEARLKAKELNYKTLFDFRNTKNYVSITDAHYWIKDFYDKTDKDIRHIPAAHLVDEENADFFDFIETSWSNQGLTVGSFYDEGAAIQRLEYLNI